MKIKRIIKPGQPGTKKLVKKYGENLVCVRYRYDIESMRMFKTIELIIEDSPWQPGRRKIPLNKIMDLPIKVDEIGLRKKIKMAGATWDPKKQVWHLPYKQVVKLGLTNRIKD